jgi:excisionase family DNA binding protein
VGEERPSSNRVTVDEAARVLGLSVDAIRKRVQRGTIDYERAEDGRVWILLDAIRTHHDIDQDEPGQQPGIIGTETIVWLATGVGPHRQSV